MKKILLLLIPVLLFSCKKDENKPINETITKGGKWNLKIGSSSAEVYAQLQQLGREKDFRSIGMTSQFASTKPEQIKDRFLFYNTLTLESTKAPVDGVSIRMDQAKVTNIENGPSPSGLDKWPLDVSDDIAIHKNDPLNKIYDKLIAIYQLPKYKDNYRLILPDKPLDKSFDPAMVNFTEWLFYFNTSIKKPGHVGNSAVRLYFKDGKLNKIQHNYDATQIVYD